MLLHVVSKMLFIMLHWLSSPIPLSFWKKINYFGHCHENCRRYMQVPFHFKVNRRYRIFIKKTSTQFEVYICVSTTIHLTSINDMPIKISLEPVILYPVLSFYGNNIVYNCIYFLNNKRWNIISILEPSCGG